MFGVYLKFWKIELVFEISAAACFNLAQLTQILQLSKPYIIYSSNLCLSPRISFRPIEVQIE